MKGVQCYELFGGIALKNHTFSFCIFFLMNWIGDLLMRFQDVAFLPSRANFSTTFLDNCGRGEMLEITTCSKTVVEGKKRHAPSKIILQNQSLYVVSVQFNGDHKTVTMMR